ncbi:MAG TPA: amidase [Rudaea sp.]|jgi:aspartyl-tRNA(Asn)/glutamyl-tRNA(Gln) amidotransferase subunit A|nr:amidase [Rudaea sp.]
MTQTITERQWRGATLCQILHWLAAGTTDAAQSTRAYLDAITQSGARLNAFVAVDANGASAQARESDVRRAQGKAIGRLDGVAVAIKDNIDVAGMPSHAGLPGARSPAARDAAVIERLRGAGAVILGKTGMDEGPGAEGKNPHFGDVHNPWRLGFSPGGSSAGSAAAVAAGLCAAAIGTDTLGSIRIPASYCGVYGFKPTSGEISLRGIKPAARRLDCVGLLARGVDDLGVLYHVLAGYDAADPRSRRRRLDPDLPDWEPGRLRVGVLADVRAWGTADDVAVVFVHALDALKHALPDRRIVDFADFPMPAARRAGLLLIEAEMLGAFPTDVLAGVSPRLARMLDYARGKSAADYATADRVVDAAVLKARRLFSQIDVLVTPTTPQTAFAHGEPAPADQADFTAFANLSGCPALSLPMGLTANGLPAGLQLMGAPGSDLRLLELAAVCAAALDTTPDYPVGDP